MPSRRAEVKETGLAGVTETARAQVTRFRRPKLRRLAAEVARPRADHGRRRQMLRAWRLS